MPHYEFDDGSSKIVSNRQSRTSGYKLYPTSSTNTNDDSLSFTYSASSSQAGDWSDGSVTDFPDELTEGLIDVVEMNPSLSSVSQLRQANDGRYPQQYHDPPSSIKKSRSRGRSDSMSTSSKGKQGQTHTHNQAQKQHQQRQGSPVSTATSDLNGNNNSKCGIPPSTPTTPPPRHSSQKSLGDDAEVW
eukprot:CAMPEP_0203706620 /NCGR_PEP_ID=MMETSP0091-20130426/53661_1 /ASSEMBLY_ACC=CAM_ASM_001089 /TAXON_ID=426623 /ORGANISM="Chaetoceros affinis, Strain CCMP159" /LENGTH=187 /DNA_ID=CAMNT_0050582523 /DNA_START=531 /DNA_END=1091 /DNA_ORIENTATION=-